MLRIDAVNRLEIRARNSLVAMGGVCLCLVTGQVITVAWGLAFVVINYAYLWWIEVIRPPVPFHLYLRALAVRTGLLVSVSAMCIYAAGQGNTVLLLLAFCGIAGLCLHSIANHGRWTMLAMMDVGNIGLTSVGIMIAVAVENAQPAGALAIMLLGSGLIAYFVHSMRGVIDTRGRLDARYAAEAQAEKMQAVGQLSAGIAHDFNNILTVIRGNLDLVDFVDDIPEKDVFLAEARAGTDRAAHLVRQLLAFSRKSQLSVSVFSLAEFIRENVEVLMRVLPENVRVSIQPDLPEVELKVDRALLNTAILNATLNARDAMLPDGGDVILSVTCKGPLAHVTIEDTGPGLSPLLFDKAVEPFYTTKPAGAGSGLGLSMIKGFAEQSGGRLELSNRPEGGLKVMIILPIYQELEDETQSLVIQAAATDPLSQLSPPVR